MTFFNISKRWTSFLGPRLSSCNISRNSSWRFLMCHGTFLELWKKVYFQTQKMTKNQPNWNFSKFWQTRASFPGPRLPPCDISWSSDWRLLRSDVVHTYSCERSIFSNKKMAKNQPNWSFSKFQNDGHHSRVLGYHHIIFDEIRPDDFWDMTCYTLTMMKTFFSKTKMAKDQPNWNFSKF